MPSTNRLRRLRTALLTRTGLLLLATGFCATSADLQVSFDPAKPGPVISPYIYGQFIEHLGRCIHDGIWAEKLRDRKFLQPLAKSAWQVRKDSGAQFDVFLDPAGAYAGEHCLAMWRRRAEGPAFGIYQTNIGVLSGKEYVGYALVSTVSGDPRLEVTLSSDQGVETVPLKLSGKGYQRVPFRITGKGTTENGSFGLGLSGTGMVWIGAVSLMPADNIDGMRADVLQLIKKLNAPIMRWPGGNFVSGYNWRDGIGPRDKRPPRWERAWNDVEDNDFGIHEFMRFCEEVKTEPYIAVNTGLGSVEDAADEVEYVTGSTRTRWGAERAGNGRSRPWKVTWWGIGNEMFGNWQLGNVPVERYAYRHNAFVDAMKQANPRIKIIAVGNPGKWNDMLLPIAAGHMDLLSGHHYTQRHFPVPFSPEDERKYTESFTGYSADVMNGVARIVSDLRSRRQNATDDLGKVRLAIDEWGIVRDWNPAPDGPGIGVFEHYYPLGDAVASARAVHELIRSADIVAMANWAQTVSVIGAIKASHNYAVLDPVGHVLALYRAQLTGRALPVKLDGSGTVDAIATVDSKQNRIAVALVNFSPAAEQTLQLRSEAGQLPDSAEAWRITGPGLGALNIPGQKENVTTERIGKLRVADGIRLAPHSVTVLEIRTK